MDCLWFLARISTPVPRLRAFVSSILSRRAFGRGIGGYDVMVWGDMGSFVIEGGIAARELFGEELTVLLAELNEELAV